MELLEKATLNALLFADRVPEKTAVCLHQTGQKRRLGPASQAACHEAGRPGHETQDGLQTIGLTDGPLAWLCAKSHAPAGGHTLLSERDGEADRIRSPQAWRSAFGWRRQGPGGGQTAGVISTFALGREDPPLAVQSSQGPLLFQEVRDLPLSTSRLLPPSPQLTRSPHREAGVIKSSVLQREKRRLKGAEIHPKSQNNQGQSWCSN